MDVFASLDIRTLAEIARIVAEPSDNGRRLGAERIAQFAAVGAVAVNDGARQ